MSGSDDHVGSDLLWCGVVIIVNENETRVGNGDRQTTETRLERVRVGVAWRFVVPEFLSKGARSAPVRLPCATHQK
jgi:hypothetical protein